MLVLFLLLAGRVFALDITPHAVYAATKEACIEVARLDLKSYAIDKINAGYFPTRAYTEIMTFIRSESFNNVFSKLDFSQSPVASYILQQPEFHQALKDCAGDNAHVRGIFVNSVAASDRAGKTFGAFMIVVSLRGWTALVKSLPQKWASYSSSLHKFALGLVGVSVLKSDTRQNTSIAFNPDRHRDQEAQNKKRYEHMGDSLRNQIQAEDIKIRNCNGCAEMKIYQANREGLRELLEIVEKNGSKRPM